MARWHLSIKSAAALAFLAVAAIPVWLAWEMPQGVAIKMEMEQARETHTAYTNAVVMALKRYHADVETGFGMLADDLDLLGDDPARDRTKALETYGFNHICKFDVRDGRLLASIPMPGRLCSETAPPERLELLRSLAVEGQIRFSRVVPGLSGQPVLLLVRRAGTMITVGALDTRYFRELASTIKFGDEGHAVILDHTGHVLAHPNPDWINPPKSMAKISVVQKLMAGQEGTGQFHSPAKDALMVSAYGSVKGAGWGILVNQPKRELEAIVTEIKRGTFKVLLIAIAIASVLAMIAAHVLLDPIRRIRLSAERLGNGHGETLIPPTGAGSRLTEINDLRAAFNAMVLRIRRSHRTEIVARKEAQEAARAKSRFLANMSHELRTPLNAIIGFAEVTQRRMIGPERERDREYLGYIHDSGRHLLSIINDLLDLSRIEAGAWLLDEEHVDVSKAILDARAMLGPMPEEKGIEIILTGVQHSTMVWADRRAVRQIMLNLTTNAVRYTQEGGRVVIGCSVDESGAVALVVNDNGPGINADELTKIRAPFSRGRAQENAAVPGTGLGLSIVDALSDLHGARFDLKSEPGEGTSAKVVFPPNRTLSTLARGAPVKAAQ